MADTALKTEEEKKEYFDTQDVLRTKAQKLAGWILQSNHFCAFTGAGLSTAAGIPDYRSGANTVLPTGAGCWEKAANIQKARKNGTLKNEPATKAALRVGLTKAKATRSHLALVELMEKGMLKHIISQNLDGLHRKSGIPAANISELHGNSNLEVCIKCKRGYMRDFRVRTAQTTKEHKTGRKCDNKSCGGDLKDTVINFGENLDAQILEDGFNHGACADVMLVLGSSLRVNPACEMVGETARHGGKVVIVNLQKTPYDNVAALVVHSKIEDFMMMLMEELNMEIPKLTLKRWFNAKIEESKTGKETLKVNGITEDGSPYDIFKTIKIDGKITNIHNLTEAQITNASTDFNLKFKFQGHYDEPELEVKLPRELIKSNDS